MSEGRPVKPHRSGGGHIPRTLDDVIASVPLPNFTQQQITLENVLVKLKANGFSGLYYPGECGCGIDDLAPCGECQPGGDYMNDCKPGYLHRDPNPGHVEYGDFVVTSSKEPPADDEFADMYN